MSGQAMQVPRAEAWADRIRAQVGRTVEAILETGRLLLAAKGELRHGEWGRLFREHLIPFSQRSANCLMAIADHPVLSNSQHVANLPPSWGTLYELTKVPEPELKRALEAGLIAPDMERDAAAALRARALRVQPTARYSDDRDSAKWPEPVRLAVRPIDPATVERLRREMADRDRAEHLEQLAHQARLQIISVGYRTLAPKCHPDRGGSAEAMARLTAAREQLKSAAAGGARRGLAQFARPDVVTDSFVEIQLRFMRMFGRASASEQRELVGLLRQLVERAERRIKASA